MLWLLIAAAAGFAGGAYCGYLYGGRAAAVVAKVHVEAVKAVTDAEAAAKKVLEAVKKV